MKKRYFGRGVIFLLCAVFAVAFLLPTVLTITNSFMSESEIQSNYGMIFSTTNGGYVSKTVNLKFIPDKVTLSQYMTGLIKSPEYLLKFWNSIILVVPIVIFQVAVASVAAFCVGGIGAFIGDLLFYPAPMFVSLATHGLQAVVISLCARRLPGNKVAASVIGVSIGAVIMVVGYSLGRAYIYSTPEYAVLKLPFQILQAVVGAVLGTILRWKVKPLAKLVEGHRDI